MIYDLGMATKRSRQKSQADLRRRIEQQVRRELTAEVERKALERAKEIICAERNTIFGTSNEHEYLPVVEDGQLREQCVVCDQRKPADFPVDPTKRRAYLEMVVTPESFQRYRGERLLARQAEKGADFLGQMTHGGPHDWQRAGNPGLPAPDFRIGEDLSKYLQDVRFESVWDQQQALRSMDTVLLHGDGQVIEGPLKGGHVTSVIFDEAVPENVAYAFSQGQIDKILAQPVTFTADFEWAPDGQRSLRNLLGAPMVAPVDAVRVISGNTA